MIKYNDRVVDVVKLLQVWRSTFEERIEDDEDCYYTHIKKDRHEARLLRNLQIDAQETIEDLFELGDIPKDANIYEE